MICRFSPSHIGPDMSPATYIQADTQAAAKQFILMNNNQCALYTHTIGTCIVNTASNNDSPTLQQTEAFSTAFHQLSVCG
jgi:hypothetical protein